MRKHNDKWKYPLTNVCKCGNNQEAKPCATVKDASGEPIIHFLGLPWRSNKEATDVATKFCERVNAQSKVGNAAKMREALSDACYAMFNFLKTQNDGYEEMAKALDKAKAALADLSRNCDVGTAEEQERRWHSNCGSGIPNCKHCKVYEQARKSGLVDDKNMIRFDCRFIWAQMPYEEGEVK